MSRVRPLARPAGARRLVAATAAGALAVPLALLAAPASGASAPTSGTLGAVTAPGATIPGDPDTIWFDEPLNTAASNLQQEWEQRALPIGNGAMGATVFGGVAREQLQLNEKTLWTGGPGASGYNFGNWTTPRPDAIQQVRDRIDAEGSVSPEEVAAVLGQPKTNFGSYQTYGDLVLEMAGQTGTATDYRRALDIGDAVVTTTYELDGTTYTREYFASAADDVVVVRLTADAPGAIGFEARLDLPSGRSNVAQAAAGGRITTSGTLTNNGLRFASQAQVLTDGGTRTDGANGRVTVAGADSATIVFSAATDYEGEYPAYRSGVAPLDVVTPRVDAAAGKGVDALREAHLADYHELYERVRLDLGAELPDVPTDELLAAYRAGTTPENQRALEALYFQFGRYLLVSSSRDGSLPANLQGVWNRVNNPPWDADYHVNINLQMNYWPAETTNLSETTAPLFDYVDSMVAPGEVTASTMYGADGWVVGNETNPYGFTGLHQYPQSFWQPDAAAWLAQHYWEHYLFTGDEEFLAERAYPMLRSVSEFWFDFLVVDPRDGSLVVTPSYSPEQGDFTAGASISQQIVTQHLANTAAAASALGETDSAFLDELAATRADLDPGLRVGSWGQLQEWKEDLDEPNNTHRHVSHLWALFPGGAVSPSSSPDLAAAARVSLDGRGDGGTGWSKAWKVNFWARLLDGDRAHKLLREQLTGSTLDNLWDNHPPFQIDGNFGGTSGVAEMLLQSQDAVVDVLPALPSAWAEGSYTGLVARGGTEVDAVWTGGAARELTVHPSRGGDLTVRSPLFASGAYTLVDGDGSPVEHTRDGAEVTFAASAGASYTASALATVGVTAPASATTGDVVDVVARVSAVGDAPIEGGELALVLPAVEDGQAAWSAEPAAVDLETVPAGGSRDVTFRVTVGAGSASGTSAVVARLTAGEGTVEGRAAIAVRPPSPCPAPPTDDTVLAWDLGEDPLADASGHGRTPRVVGTGAVLAEGPTGSAQTLGPNTYVASEPFQLGYLYQASFAGEFRIDAGQSSYRRLFDAQPVGQDADGILVDLTPSNNVRVITAGTGTTTPVTVPTGRWFDLVVTIGENGAITVYVDGVARPGGTIGGYGAINGCQTRPFHVGANQGGGEVQRGAVDRVAVFARALTADEVATWQELAFDAGEPGPDVSVEVQTRCLAGRAYVVVRATNDDDAPLDVTLETPYGTRTVAGVQPGANAYQSFAVRATTVGAGTATVTARAAADGPVTTHDVAFEGRDC
ncbi:glycoside hydrolase N-terminal domain-containing protein [Cellulosimicrobium cellulans]|uniref:glycosyl hydrolase family 95 catalytic domain-containing protein n=1 Tax=Cellulosimicrobium cellulans TaxID=1710 RepID=UPI0036E615EB